MYKSLFTHRHRNGVIQNTNGEYCVLNDGKIEKKNQEVHKTIWFTFSISDGTFVEWRKSIKSFIVAEIIRSCSAGSKNNFTRILKLMTIGTQTINIRIIFAGNELHTF